MYLIWVLLICLPFKLIAAFEQHCIEPANCQFYPIHGCYATEAGLTCQTRNYAGFEMSIDPIHTFIYTPLSNSMNDTGLPCHTIPVTDELISYVEYRGPQVIDIDDLDLIGNCTTMSYCDKKTHTCQPKMPVGSLCKYNMQCYYGTDGYPGHCSNGTCSAREDIPPYYYNMSPHWTLGDQWKSAVVALLVTGSIAIAALIGRTQLKKLYHFIKTKIDAYRGRIAARDNIRNNLLPYIWSEQLWNEQHEQQQRWWSQVPGMHWVYNKLKRNQIEQPQYHPLDDRGDVSQTVALTEEPPPYRED